MLNVRLNRFRRRWSIAHDMDGPTSTAIESPSRASVPLPSPSRWFSAAPAPPPATPDPPHRPRRRRPRSLHVPRLSRPSAIIPTPQLIAPLHAHFPARYSASDWQLVYSSMRDGVSLQTFYAKCAGPDPIVLVLRDGGRAIFGCYTTVPWKSSKQYYGNGEGFVFTLAPTFNVYKWSRTNSFFQLASSNSLAMGGGGKFAIFLDSMFERGSSGPCATYNSPCLASTDQFDVIVVEAYKLVAPFKLVLEEKEN